MIILDTNLWVSYELNRSSQLGQRAKQALDSSAYAFSESTFSELTEVLLREKFERYLPHAKRAIILREIAAKADWFTPTETVRLCRDPKDDIFLELALACDAHYLITGDADLLALDPFYNTRIVTIAQYASEHHLSDA